MKNLPRPPLKTGDCSFEYRPGELAGYPDSLSDKHKFNFPFKEGLDIETRACGKMQDGDSVVSMEAYFAYPARGDKAIKKFLL